MIKYLIFNKKSSFIYLFIISTQIPFLEFIKHNLHQTDFIYEQSFVFLNFATLSSLIILTYFLKIVFRKKNVNFTDSFLIISSTYILLFQHNSLKFFLLHFFKSLGFDISTINAEISLFLILLLSVLIFFFVLKKSLFIKRFLLIFFSLYFIAISSQIFLLTNFHDHTNNIKLDNKIILNDQLNKKKENVYFFILDGMQPIEDFENFYDLDQENFFKFAHSKNYKLLNNTKNFYTTTRENLSALFHMDKIFDEDKKKKYKYFYPSVFKRNVNTKLILNLENLGYEIKWIGNIYAYCAAVNLKYCLEKKSALFNPELYISFFKKSPFVDAIMKIGILADYDLRRSLLYENNDGMGRLLKYLKKNNSNLKNKQTFYFVHHLSPHWPYITKSNCEYTDKYPDQINFEGYKNAYLCNLKKIREIINYLNLNDPNASVVFQADHNWDMSSLSEQKYGNRKSIFNLIKIDKTCKNDDNVNLNNVNTLILFFSCLTGNDIKFVD